LPITLQRIFCANRKHSSGQACRLARLALLPHLLSYLVAIHLLPYLVAIHLLSYLVAATPCRTLLLYAFCRILLLYTLSYLVAIHLLSYLVAIHTFCRTLLLLRLVVRCCYTPFVVPCCYTPFAVPCCYTPFVVPCCHTFCRTLLLYTPFVVPCCCYTLSYVVAIRLLSYLVAVPFALAYLPYLDMLPGCIRNRKGGLFCIQEWASYDLRYQLQCNSMGNMHGHHMTIAIIYHLS